MKKLSVGQLPARELVVDLYEPFWVYEGLIALKLPKMSKQPLVVGDYAWRRPDGDCVGIERKTPSDFISSFQAGRLQTQVANLVYSYDLPILLLDGHFRRLRSGHTVRQFPYQTVISTLLRFQIAGVQVVHTDGSEECLVHTLAGLYNYLQQPHTWTLRPQPGKLASALPVPLRVIASIPGVGPQRATVLLHEFKSVEWLCKALVQEPDRVMACRGIGPKAYTQLVAALIGGEDETAT